MTAQNENNRNNPDNPTSGAAHTPTVARKALGRVTLIGAGPGDPGLITVRGMERLRQADVVVYDALANPRLLEEVRPDALLIDAGKRSKQHKLTQDQTQELLVTLAQNHALVVRLKGGDPYLFGRGAEEAAYLAKHGVLCEVVPGVTSGIAAPAMAGVPVTHRSVASTVTFVTGHENPDKDQTAVDYDALAKLAIAGGTLCFYMGVGRLGQIAQSLVKQGLAAKTPAAIVQWGTHAKQKSIRTTLATACDDLQAAGIGAPAMIVVGQVAGMDEPGLDYFTTRPLFGQRIVVTRTRQQVSQLRNLLEELGADVLEAPTIQLVPPASWDEVDEAIQKINQYDWLVLSSINAVQTLAQRLDALSLDARHFAGVKIAVIGEPTAEALQTLVGLKADLSPARFIGESLAQVMIKQGVKDQSILCLRADIARPKLPEMLETAGANVTQVTAYESQIVDTLPENVIEAFAQQQVDWVTFTSASTARNLATLLGDNQKQLANVKIASIGPITTQAVHELGLKVHAEPQSSTIEYLVQAMVYAHAADHA